MFWNKIFVFSFLISSMLACKTNSQNSENESEATSKESVTAVKKVDEEVKHNFEIVKSEEEWRSQLSDFEYHVLRDKGTERAFTGDLLKNKKEGVYICKACDYELFRSDTKFKSGTGWPSFFDPITKEQLALDTDYDVGYERTEVMCGRCGGHLGHVFKDGPEPTGLRYCINSISLKFKEN